MAKELSTQEILAIAGDGGRVTVPGQGGRAGRYNELTGLIEKMASVARQMGTSEMLESVTKDSPKEIVGFKELIAQVTRLAELEEQELRMKAGYKESHDKKMTLYQGVIDKEQERIDAHGRLHEAERAVRDGIIQTQMEVLATLQKLVNQMRKFSGRSNPTVTMPEPRDPPVYKFEIKRDQRGFMQEVIATPNPASDRPGPY